MHGTTATSDNPAEKPVRGLFDPADYRDGCGVACVARLDGEPIHEVVVRALIALDRLEHRGASGADESTGDGAGIMLGLPHEFLRLRVEEFGLRTLDLPRPGRLAVAVCFLPAEKRRAAEIEARLEELLRAGGQLPLGWRDVPVEPAMAGRVAQRSMPVVRQLLVGAGAETTDQDEFERRLFVIRRRAEIELGAEASFPSFSSRTIVYKGMLTAPQLPQFYPDLTDPTLVSRFAIVHSRFSTNTAPSWELSQPLRFIAHNGEINTALGNVNWMRAREAVLSSPAIGPELAECLPLISADASDSAAFDRTLELLVLAGRPLVHAMMMMIPAAWENDEAMAAELRDFYGYHARALEPWDGPAAIAFSDGRTLAATLDRNGLRPGRWVVTTDGWAVAGSEAGIFSTAPERVARKGRLRPGQLFVVDLESGSVRADGEVEREIAGSAPWGRWAAERTLGLDDLPEVAAPDPDVRPLRERQLAFGYTQEDLRILLAPLARDSREPTGSMGNDLPLAVLSDQRPSLFSYFKQRFAQVTNPAIDSVRESTVMSLRTSVGSQGNLLVERGEQPLQLELDDPVLTDVDLARLRASDDPALRSETIDTTWPLADGAEGLDRALARIRGLAVDAVAAGATVIVLSDRVSGPRHVAIPSLLALAAVHHGLVREGTRLSCSIVVESGEPREIHHLALLIGYGATAVNPYLMLESIAALDVETGLDGQPPDPEACEHALSGIRKGLLKVISKMGISTIHSYRGAQIFEAIGLDEELIAESFTGTPSRLGGVGLDELAREALDRHACAYPEQHGLALAEHVEAARLPAAHERLLPQGGVYRWRRDAERHMWDPATVSALQRSVRNGAGEGEIADGDAYEEFSRLVDVENGTRATLRGQLRLRRAAQPVPLAEVEPATEIVRRFSTGAMSLGALSPEAHETLAIAMNRLGAWSNSGEGGEDRRRNLPDPNGDERRSRIRQIASGRFGVDVDYLARADQIQIKIAQGAKPGEGGQLPGHKVDDYIAKLRFATPGVELISPPPHHDIYSIEDLKQLIYDLRAANPRASVSVKLAAESGVGTVATGVVKAGADHVVIAGHDGGTGASPLSSIQQAGAPWEIGLAETQQALLASELRSRVVLQSDGQMRTGRDVVIAALLGSDEIGISTAPLIATGCIMMRVCHLNTCPVGVATQDRQLRDRFAGTPEQVVSYLLQVAEEARRLMAELGVRRYEQLIGHTELLEPDPDAGHWKGARLDLRPLLVLPELPAGEMRGHFKGLDRTATRESFDSREILPAVEPALERGEPVRIDGEVANTDLAVGGLLSSEIVSRCGHEGLPAGTIELRLTGSAGQSCGAWLAPGVVIALEGEVNDYAGKGLSGGVLAVRPPERAPLLAAENVIAGNVALYGATGGRAFFAGLAGERFAVRNSGADAVVEGVGEHGCEYMTGGRVVVLGATGRNFAAGMSGGIAYVHDPEGRLGGRHNPGLVDLEAVPATEAEELRALVVEHAERTGSVRAAELLDRWEGALGEFVRVIPRGYRKALEERGEDLAEAVA